MKVSDPWVLRCDSPMLFQSEQSKMAGKAFIWLLDGFLALTLEPAEEEHLLLI